MQKGLEQDCLEVPTPFTHVVGHNCLDEKDEDAFYQQETAANGTESDVKECDTMVVTVDRVA